MAKTIYDKIIDKGKEDAKQILADGLKTRTIKIRKNRRS